MPRNKYVFAKSKSCRRHLTPQRKVHTCNLCGEAVPEPKYHLDKELSRKEHIKKEHPDYLDHLKEKPQAIDSLFNEKEPTPKGKLYK